MIGNALELTRYLSQQAQNSGFAKAAIIIVWDNNKELHQTQFGLTAAEKQVQENSTMEMAKADVPSDEAKDI